jgi:hypothetical protein
MHTIDKKVVIVRFSCEYAAHIADKYIKDNAKEEGLHLEICPTGQLKRIFASKVTSLAKIIADGDERF